MIAASIFAGCGGSSLGYRAAGYRVAYACERDPLAAETYELNNPGAVVDRRGVEEVRGAEIVEACGGEVDLLDLSPPCQGFSQIGRRDPGDPRGEPMLEETARIVAEVRPRAVVIENVVGLAEGWAREALDRLLGRLRAEGYVVRGRILDASRFGVPQSRHRLYVTALLGGPMPPAPRPLPGVATIRDAIPGALAVVCLGRPRGAWAEPKEFPAWGPAPTVATGGVWRRYAAEVEVEMEDGSRPITWRDAAALQGFPGDFRWPERAQDRDRWRMIGNSVPPPLARAVGEALAERSRDVAPATAADPAA